jgi:nitroreductase
VNPIIEQMMRHRSIRKYKDQDVPQAVLEKILAAGIMASSSGNMQAHSIIVTRDRKTREKLFQPHFSQSMVLDAPVLLTFCADFHRMRRWLELSGAPDNFGNFMSFMIGAIDATLVSQNVALAAESEGLGICYMGTTLASCGEIAEILHCPKNVVPVVGFSLGYPDEAPSERRRLPQRGVVHDEVYRAYSDSEIREIYGEREKLGWERYMANDNLRAAVLESGVENLAQIYTRLKYTRESHEGYSREVLECLRERGFF